MFEARKVKQFIVEDFTINYCNIQNNLFELEDLNSQQLNNVALLGTTSTSEVFKIKNVKSLKMNVVKIISCALDQFVNIKI